MQPVWSDSAVGRPVGAGDPSGSAHGWMIGVKMVMIVLALARLVGATQPAGSTDDS